MKPILTITLNPTVDLSITAPAITPDRKLRCSRPDTDPGGGGINVSRAIHELGGTSTAFVAVGGPTGDKVMRLLAETGIGLMPFPAPGETRQSMTATDLSSGAQYRFVMPGPDWTLAAMNRALARIVRAAPTGGLTVLSGSLPPGLPDDFSARLAARIARCRTQLLLDISGAALQKLRTITTPPADVLRLDDLEARHLAGSRLDTAADSADFASSLVRDGVARAVILARGAEGNVMATAEDRWCATAPQVPVTSRVGAGDSFVAGFTLATARGAPLPEALRHGTAAAAAAVMTPATDLCRARDVRRLLPQCRLVRL